MSSLIVIDEMFVCKSHDIHDPFAVAVQKEYLVCIGKMHGMARAFIVQGMYCLQY